MPTHEAEAVVLRQYTLAEADRIIVFFSREFGKIRAVAKGARKVKSHFGGCLEPLTQVRIQFYTREGADLGRINSCEVVHSYLGFGMELEKLHAFTYISEIIQEIVQENNPNPFLYRLFIASLDAGEKVGVRESLVRYFEIWCLRLSGLLPNYATCPMCGKCVKDSGFYAWLEAGQARCADCSRGRGLYVPPSAARMLLDIASLSPGEFALRPAEAGAVQVLETLTQRLFELHLEKRFKSYESLKEIFRH